MASHVGTLRIEGDHGSAVDCVVTVGNGRLSVASDRGEIGQWNLGEVGFSRTTDGFRLEVEGEVLLLACDEADALAVEVGLAPGRRPPIEEPTAEFEAPTYVEAENAGQGRTSWWQFWDPAEWKKWWHRRQAWRRYQRERRGLNQQAVSTQLSLTDSETRLASARRDRGWAEGVGPTALPMKSARDETGLASVDGVSLWETRKREGKDVWTIVDGGTVHFTDRKVVFVGSSQNVEFRYDKLTATTVSSQGLSLAVSTRKRSHILSGPSDRLHALLVACQAVAAGNDPTSPFDAGIDRWTSEHETHRSHLEGLRVMQTELDQPARPLSPGWIPASALILFLFIGGAFSPSEQSVPAAVTTTTADISDADAAALAAAETTTTTAPTTITTEAAPEADEDTATAAAGTVDVEVSGELVVWFLDVGQGDSTLLQGPDFTVVIDAGRHDRSDVAPHLRSAGVTEIDLLVGTHPHADHIGQFPEVLASFPVTEVWMSGDTHTTLTYEQTLDAIEASDAGYHEPRAGETYRIGSATIEVVNPTRISGDAHDGSLSLRVVYGEVAFMFTGDAETATESAMVARGYDLGAQVLQVGHHGSRTSSSTGFLQAVSPEVAVYSASTNNQYGHPHSEAMERLTTAGAVVYGTDVHGTVRVVTDGTTFEVDAAGDAVSAPTAGSTATTSTMATTTTTSASPSSGCGPGQVDINTAGFEELQQIIQIGPDRAQQILDLRPFSSVDSMTRISGIAEARLAEVKAQGVACVS